MADRTTSGPTGGLVPHITLAGGRAAEAIDFYKVAFAATELSRMPADDGKRLMHAHLVINDASLMLNDDFPEYHNGAYNAVPGGITLHLQVENADIWFDRAVKAGATAKMPPQDMFWGDRYGQIVDPFGFQWSIANALPGKD